MSADQKLALKFDMNRMNMYSESVNSQKMMKPLWADIYNSEEEFNSLPSDDFKTFTVNGNTFHIDQFKETDWQAVPEEIYANHDQQYQEDWLTAQKKFAQRLMVNRSVNEVVKKYNFDAETPQFVQTRKKEKNQLTPYTAQTLDSRSEEITKIHNLSESLNNNKDFVASLNALAGKNTYKVNSKGKIVTGSGVNHTELVFDFEDKNMIAVLLGEAAGIDRSIINASFLP